MAPNELSVLEEPELEFRFRQRVTRPQDGLTLFGPVDADSGAAPGGMSYGLVGTPEGLSAFAAFAEAMRGPVSSPENKKAVLWPLYPGFDAAFNIDWPSKPAWTASVDGAALQKAAQLNDRYQRVNAVVSLILTPMENALKGDEQPRVVICIVPDEIWKTCRPTQTVRHGWGEKTSAKETRTRVQGGRDLFDTYDPAIYRLAPDFRRQLKARAMKTMVPVQIIRQSTLSVEKDPKFSYRGLTPLPDRMWNLSTTLYYKAGGRPWKLATAREGVCYVGLAFRLQSPGVESRNGCCAAQMFIDDGDGIVFLGEFGPWYSPETKQFHLTATAARTLLGGVLDTYAKLKGKPIREVFLHAKSGVDPEEYDGYNAAMPKGAKLVGVRVRSQGSNVRLFREGTRPVLRGTCLQVSERSCYLWTSGFKPELAAYDGWDVPVPLSIQIQHGSADIQQVARDIFGLTKLNYNACKLGDSEPVTVGFSDAVGEILISNPGVKDARPQFRYYI